MNSFTSAIIGGIAGAIGAAIVGWALGGLGAVGAILDPFNSKRLAEIEKKVRWIELKDETLVLAPPMGLSFEPPSADYKTIVSPKSGHVMVTTNSEEEVIFSPETVNGEITRLSDRLAVLQARVDAIGKSAEGKNYPVSNPALGKETATCPVGWVVTGISAPQGVGGRYATDGIAKLNVHCKPILD